MIKSLQVIQVIGSLDGEAAGPSYSVPRLCDALAKSGHLVSLLSGTREDFRSSSAGLAYANHRYPFRYTSLPMLGKLGISPELRKGLLATAKVADVYHAHGLWRFPTIYPAEVARRTGSPLVLTPRGMLAPKALEFSSISKKVFWSLRQKNAVTAVSAFHATSLQEYKDIRAFGLQQPVAIVPNGIDLPRIGPSQSNRHDTPTVLFLGRLHPVKAIDRLIKAWHLLGDVAKNWKLRIVGPVEVGYDIELRKLIAQLRLSNVELPGPVRPIEKWNLLMGAELTVLPSLSENFGISVAESLASQTPVIASHGTPWQDVETHRCGWWVDNSPESLASALASAMSLSTNERIAMGRRGRNWMERDFSWSGIASKMEEVYRWLLGVNEAPHFIMEE